MATLSPDNPVGAIIMFAGATPPSGYLLCNGSYYSSVSYPALYAAIQYTYTAGGASSAIPPTFQVPDLRAVIPIGAGPVANPSVSASPRLLGQIVGLEWYALQTVNVPAHTHSGTTGTENAGDYAGILYAASATNVDTWEVDPSTWDAHINSGGVPPYLHTHAFTTDSGSGSGQAFQVTPPAMGLNFIIKAGPPPTPTPSATPSACHSYYPFPRMDLNGTLVGSAAFPAASYPDGFTAASEAECMQQCCAAAVATGCTAYAFASFFLTLGGGGAPCFLYGPAISLVYSSGFSSGVQTSAYTS